MDESRFDRLSRALAGADTRRGFVQVAVGLAVAALPLLPDDAGAAKRRSHRGDVSAEHFRHKKRFYCLNGETIRRYRRKQEKLLAMGATLGKCGPCVPTTCEALGFICGPASDGCGGTLQCGTCDDPELDTCCTGQCVSLDDDNNCGECGNVCTGILSCFLGECLPL
jgi:hypothetical protein